LLIRQVAAHLLHPVDDSSFVLLKLPSATMHAMSITSLMRSSVPLTPVARISSNASGGIADDAAVGLGADVVLVVVRVDGVDVVVLGYELTPLGAVASPVVVLLHAARSTGARPDVHGTPHGWFTATQA
jgi:hypothetical protein